MEKTKSMKGKEGQRKLASGHGRGKVKSGGEASRAGSSKPRKS